MVNCRWVPPTEIVLTPDVIVGLLPHPELSAAVTTSVIATIPKRRGPNRCILVISNDISLLMKGEELSASKGHTAVFMRHSQLRVRLVVK
jgi:hypothetical protein